MMKTQMFNCIRGLLMFAAVAASTVSSAQKFTPLPADAAVLQGRLPNGLTYFIRHNDLPQNSADFYIAQKVGAILEEDSQNGLAHFLEHMAFNGTKNFPDKGIIDYFERNGVRFGANINAYTSLDETIYYLASVPTANPGLVDSALLVLHDWSSCISLLDKEIDNERGVILEEWRTSSSAARRFFFGHMANTMPGTPYAVRDIIGDTAVINNFSYQEISNYYHKWYRPDLQGIVIVGDINPVEVEKRIKEMWSDVPTPVNPAERVYFTVPVNDKPVISILRDAEATNTDVNVSFRSPAVPDSIINSVEYMPMRIIQDLCVSVINTRLADLAHKGCAFVSAGAYDYEIVPTLASLLFTCTPKEGQTAQAVETLLCEIEKLRRYGVNPGELQRACDDLVKKAENAYANRNKTRTSTYSSSYANCFIENKVITSVETDRDMTKQIAPHITTEHIAAYLNQIFQAAPVFEISTLPADEGVLTEEKYVELFNSMRNRELEAYKDEVVDTNLIDNEPQGGKVVSRVVDPVYDATVVTLSNGLKVSLKPTTYADNQILLNGSSHGGYTTLDAEYAASAQVLRNFTSAMGLGKYSEPDLRKALTGRTASAGTSISLYSDNVSGSSSKVDFETMLQLVYMQFAPQRRDEEAFNSMSERLNSYLANSMKDPSNVFSKAVYTAMYDNNPYRPVITEPKDIENVTIDRVCKLHDARFGSAKGFDFEIVGSFEIDSVLPLVAKWIGGLPTDDRQTKVVDRQCYGPQQAVDSSFRVEMETPKVSSFTYISHKCEYDRKNQLALQCLDRVLNIRYLESIREAEGGTYGVGVNADLGHGPNSQYHLLMEFDTNEEMFDKLLGIIFKEVEDIAASGPKAGDFEKVTKALIKSRQDNLQKNSTWLSLLKSRDLYGEDDSKYEEMVNSITPADVQEWAKRILSEGHRVQVTMKPVVKQ